VPVTVRVLAGLVHVERVVRVLDERNLQAAFHEARHAKWRSWADVRRQYATASHVGDRIVFNIKGNDYRLVVAVDYQRQGVWIKWIGTHAQYDKINVREVKYGD